MKKIPLIDDAFLRLESRRQPLHIGVLMLFEPPEGAGDDFAQEIDRKLRQSKMAAGLFNRLLVEKRGAHYWQNNEDFDLAHHFVHLALPHPGRVRELLDMVSRLHCGHLDRSYPLWRAYLIEGLNDGRIAVYLKVHHSMVDGVGGVKVLVESMAPTAAASTKLPPFWETLPERAKKRDAAKPPSKSQRASSALRAPMEAVNRLRAAQPVFQKLRQVLADRKQNNPDAAFVGAAPKCTFNQRISGTRRFAAQSYETRRIKAVATAVNGTRNDVILAMVSGALRTYLEQHDELPDISLNALVPTSIRSKAGANKEAGNAIAFMVANLATTEDEPLARLQAIKRSMDYNKAQMSDLTAGQIQAFSGLAQVPGALNLLLDRNKGKTLGNVLVSHVPGPKTDLYWQGAKLSGIYPMSLLLDTAGLNVTIISRHDNIDFGIIACRQTVPQVQRLLRYLEDALSELEAAVAAQKASGDIVQAVKPKATKAPPKAVRKKRANATRKKVTAKAQSKTTTRKKVA